MKHTVNIDLRKSDPLGLDLDLAWQVVQHRYQRADAAYAQYEKNQDGSQLDVWRKDRSEARRLHSLLRIIANLVGPDNAAKIPALKWAMEYNFSGERIYEPHTGQQIEAKDINRKWRPARVVGVTPANSNVGEGRYVQWLDVDPNDLSKSQSAWVTLDCTRPARIGVPTITPGVS